MRLTVLGRSPACPNPGGACSGYLVEDRDTSILMDCGTGIVSRLREIVDYRRISAIIITHMHADHFLDIIPYVYGLRLLGGALDGFRPELLLPPGGRQTLETITSLWKDLPAFTAQVFRMREFDPAQTLQIGRLTVSFAETVHFIPCWSLRVEGESKVIVYSSDSGPSASVEALARGADLLLAEAALLEKRGVAGEEGHMTPHEAGEMARRAGVRRLILTHFWAEFDQDKMARDASAAFGGPAEIAEEWKSYIL